MTGPQRLSFFAQLSNCNLSQSCHIRPFPRVLLCLLNIPKIRIKTVHVIGCSLSLQNLHISYYCSSVFWKYGQRLVEYGQAIDPQNLSLSSHPLLKKARTFGLGCPPPSLNKHNRFQYTAPSHLENWSGEGGGSGAKSPAFCNGRQIRFNKQSLYAWLWNEWASIYIDILCQYQISWESLDVTCGPSIKSFAGHRIWICTPGP